MNYGARQFQNRMYRLGMVGGGLVLGYAFFEPYMPVIITVAASLVIGFSIRALFTSMMNKKLNQTYRYTSGSASAHTGSAGAETKSKQQKPKQPPKSKQKTAADNANTAHGGTGSAHGGGAAHERDDIPPPEPPPRNNDDSLSLYRNLLGLKPGFTADELKAAYRDAAAKYHPDRYAAAPRRDRENAETLMKQINEAYGILRGR
ncbi:MAG: J domain-containing protein [Spirochaetaceae bacterium]|jgi:predicted lipid-binding transport protein (Tim44 family)|nr:J domain-containing protein [Spirochaetaceae bacterium]